MSLSRDVTPCKHTLTMLPDIVTDRGMWRHQHQYPKTSLSLSTGRTPWTRTIRWVQLRKPPRQSSEL